MRSFILFALIFTFGLTTTLYSMNVEVQDICCEAQDELEDAEKDPKLNIEKVLLPLPFSYELDSRINSWQSLYSECELSIHLPPPEYILS